MQQRKEQHNDLQDALFSMKRITDTTPLPEIHLQMFLIEEGCLPFDTNKMVFGKLMVWNILFLM